MTARSAVSTSKLAGEEERIVHDLIDSVVEKAHGVFLWIYLVVKSLIEGFVKVTAHQHSLDELRRSRRIFTIISS